MSTAGPFDVIDFKRQRPALVDELLREHVDDGTGHCRGCSWWQSATRFTPAASPGTPSAPTRRVCGSGTGSGSDRIGRTGRVKSSRSFVEVVIS